MARHTRVFALAAVAAAALGASACQPAAEAPDAAETDTTHTIIETREVAVPPVVVEQPAPDIVVDREPSGDTTTVRAGRDGLEVETTNR